jgi:hypothetical protein
MTVYDKIAETAGDDECRTWIRKVIDAKDESWHLLRAAWM